MRLTKYILFFLLFQSFCSNAQEVEGFVFTESTRLPLSDVNIVHKKSNTGTTTNRLGKFVLELNLSPNDTITFSHVGYSSNKWAVKDLERLNYRVFLARVIQELSEVNVISDRDRKLRSTIKYETLSPLKKGLHSFAAVAFEGSILVIGGDESVEENEIRKRIIRNPALDPKKIVQQSGGDLSWRHYSGKIQVYDISSNQWEISAIEIRNRAYHTAHLNQNKLYILGGKRLVRRGKYEYLDDKIEVIDLKTGVVQIDNTNPHQASSLTSFINGNNLIVAGGAISEDIRGKKKYSNKLHEYNFESGFWYELGALPKTGNIWGAMVGNFFYAVIWTKNSSCEVYSYNLDSDLWNRELQITIGLENPAITSIDNSIYIFESNRILNLDVNTKSLREYTINLDIKGANILSTDGEIYIIGGVKENRYSKIPSSGLYRISLSELHKTKS